MACMGFRRLPAVLVGAPAAWLDRAGTPKAVALTSKLRIAIASYVSGNWSRWRELGWGF